MALTQEQWYSKLKNLVPAWVTQNPKAQATFMSVAKGLAEEQAIAEQHKTETYIKDGSDDFVALHGSERSVGRLPNESLEDYADRVQSIENQSNYPALKLLVDALLIRGTSVIIEHHSPNNFLDRGGYLDRLIIDFQVLYNAFTILIDDQTPEAKSFYDRSFFADREDVYGALGGSSDEVFNNIIKVVNKNKAYGTVYRLIERRAK